MTPRRQTWDGVERLEPGQGGLSCIKSATTLFKHLIEKVVMESARTDQRRVAGERTRMRLMSVPALGVCPQGKLTYRFADHEEIFEAGDAFYLPPGHVPLAEAGSELVHFSPSAELREVEAVMMKEHAGDAGRLSERTSSGAPLRRAPRPRALRRPRASPRPEPSP